VLKTADCAKVTVCGAGLIVKMPLAEPE